MLETPVPLPARATQFWCIRNQYPRFKHGIQFAGWLNQGKYQVFDSLSKDAPQTRGWRRAAFFPSIQWFHHNTLPIFKILVIPLQ
jgi:hypothetical protein